MVKNIKISTIFLGCILFRLLPFRAPNLEPIMASIIPISKKYSILITFVFAFLSMVLYDFITGFVGLWTWITAFSYGGVALASFYFFKKFQSKTYNNILFVFFATILFDLVTGVLVAPFFGVSIGSAFILQIPFTLIHLASNIGFVLTITPVLNYWLASEKVFSFKISSAFDGLKT